MKRSMEAWAGLQIACLLGLMAFNTDGGEAVLLKAKWRAGERSLVQMTSQQQIKTRVPNQPKPFTQDMTMTFYMVAEVTGAADGGGYEIVLEYTDIAVDMTAQGQTMTFDSREQTEGAQDPKNPFPKIFGSMVGARFGCTLGEGGKIKGVKGVKEFVEKVLNANPDPQTKQAMKGFLNEDFLKQNLAANIEHEWLPKRPVKVGDKWPHKQDLPAGPLGTLSIEQLYTFTRWEEIEGVRCAVLEFEGTMRGTPPETQEEAPFRITAYDASLDGTTWFDPEDGQVIKTETTQDVQTNATANVPNQGQQNIATDVHQVITVELVGTEKIEE